MWIQYTPSSRPPPSPPVFACLMRVFLVLQLPSARTESLWALFAIHMVYKAHRDRTSCKTKTIDVYKHFGDLHKLKKAGCCHWD